MSKISVLNWINLAEKDYIAARCLFLSNFVLQGAILSNTAIEKYLKAIFVAKNPNQDFGKIFKQSFKHEILSMYQELKLDLKLNSDYLELLGKSYKARYFDQLEEGFNFCLVMNKMLFELDRSIFELKKGFIFESKKDIRVKTIIDNFVEDENKNLLVNNCYFGSCQRDNLFVQETSVYEIRIHNGELMEAYYGTITKDDNKFGLVALNPKM